MALLTYVLNAVSTVAGKESFKDHAGKGLDADKTAFEAALATLVADGATPTQAHVTAANNAYTLLKADLNADAVLIINGSNVTTQNTVKAIFREFVQLLAGRKDLTP